MVRSALLTALVGVVTLPGCYGIVMAPRPAPQIVVHESHPPPHAPAHGYRHKHESGAKLRFVSRLGVYVVVGHTNLYFHDGWFVRVHDGIWEVSVRLDGPWKPKRAGRIPPGLRAKHHAKKPKHRGHGPAKIGW